MVIDRKEKGDCPPNCKGKICGWGVYHLTRILALLGSHRRLGNSEVLLREVVGEIQRQGAEVEALRLTELSIQACRGCMGCVFGKKGGCSIDDDMATLVEKIIDADGLIVAAPTYVLSPAAIVKMVIDRFLMVTHRLSQVYGKPRAAVTISVAGLAPWNPFGPEMLNLLPLTYGFPVIDYQEAFAPGPAETLLDPANVERARLLGKRLVRHLQGEPYVRPVESGQCPACYNRYLSIQTDGFVVCPLCQSRGIWTGNSITWDSASVAHNRWTPEHMQEHMTNWVIASRERFVQNRAAVKEKLANIDSNFEF